MSQSLAIALPLYPLTREHADRFGLEHLRQVLPPSCTHLVCRVPEADDVTRWRPHRIGGQSYQVAQPITFTPYAAAQPCSARCLFCSENLRVRGGYTPAALQRPGAEYFEELRLALRELEGLPLSYSLSGLELTDDVGFMGALLDVLTEHAVRSPVEQRVLYSNGAGFAGEHRAGLIARLRAFDLSWLELSRHHFDAVRNQNIMRFRDGQAHRDASVFDALLAELCQAFGVKLVCIAQRDGVDSVAELRRYWDWAAERGVKNVILREFSKLDASYLRNGTARYIDGARVDVEALLVEASQRLGPELQLHTVTAGYYFWNVVGSYHGMEVTFEVADYALMHAQHGSSRIFKLVHHANGALCAGWDPDQHLLFDARSARSRSLRDGS